MKLDFILSDTTGGAILNAINEITSLDVKNEVVVLVPENSSLMIEQLILNKTNATSSISVYSFVRLLEKIDTSNKDKYISKENAVLIVRKIILDNYEKLVCFKKSAKKIGFAEIVYDTISQFKASRITAEEAQDLANKVPESLKIKMKDIALIYYEYQKYISDRFLDNCDKLDYLSKAIYNTDYLNDKEVYVVGFESLTTQGAEFIGEVAKVSKSVKVACTFKKNDGESAEALDCEVFEKVKQVANRYNYPYNPTFKEEQKNAILKHLAENLNNYPYVKKEIKDEVLLYEASGPREEVSFIADKIYSDVFMGKVKPKEIAIYCANPIEYENFFKTELSDRLLPYFISKQHNLLSHPLFLLVCKCLDCVRRGYTKEDVIELSKNILLDFNDDVDIFENYCVKYSISYKGFFKPFEFGKDNEKYAKIEEIRAKIMKILQIFAQNIKNATNIEMFSNGVLCFFDEINIKERLNNLYNLSLKLNKESAEITRQSYDKFANMLSGLITFMGSSQTTIDEFYALIISGAEAVKISCLPVSLGGINITSDFLSISPLTKDVYICGTLDGVVPLRQDDCGIVLDNELGSLSDVAQKKIEPTIRTINRRERFKIFNLLLLAKRQLVLTYPAFNIKGEECKPSNLISKIQRIFTQNGKELPIFSSFTYKNNQNCRFYSPKTAEKFLIENALKEKENINYEDNELLSTLYYALSGHLSETAKNILYNINVEPEIEKITNATNLYFPNKSVSISQLEKYFACPLLHFLSYGLGAKEKEDGSLRALDVGNILHYIAEHFVKNIEKVNKNNILDVTKKIINNALDELQISKEKNALVLSVVSGEAIRLCKYIYDEHLTSSFKSIEEEYSFGAKNPSVVFKNDIKLVGKVDRIDAFENYLKIIDYKTGNISVDAKDIYYGRKIQLISYLLALKNYRNLKSVAVLYFPIHNEFAQDKEAGEDLYRNSGLIVNNLNVIRAIDNNLSLSNPKSHKIKVELKNNEQTRQSGVFELKNSDNLVSEETLDGLTKYVYSLSNKAIEEILDGNIICSPLKTDASRIACDYCPMKKTCGVLNFDLKNGRSMNKKITNEQIAEADYD
ncbi:MAG: PD-(D/E)XK nuclease family protein [Clostridia bacterium]|nr:PD-(D/E)XK nuclease family protein [Clostridia bacterium]